MTWGQGTTTRPSGSSSYTEFTWWLDWGLVSSGAHVRNGRMYYVWYSQYAEIYQRCILICIFEPASKFHNPLGIISPRNLVQDWHVVSVHGLKWCIWECVVWIQDIVPPALAHFDCLCLDILRHRAHGVIKNGPIVRARSLVRYECRSWCNLSRW